MKEDHADDIQQLLEQFLNDIYSGAGTAFYDEDDLVVLFDYASYIENDYARFEVLMCGSRLYPASVPLSERKAFYLYQQGYLNAASASMKNLPDTSFFKKMLSILLTPPKGENTIESTFDKVLASVRDFEDEEVILLVNVAVTFDLYKWLLDNYDAILSKCSYKQSFIFELLNKAERRGDFKMVIKLAEELTLLEPFNGEFWEKLADVHISNNFDIEKGLSYLEYALAINPDSVNALLLKASGLNHLDKPIEDILVILDKAKSIDPDNLETVQFRALYLYGRGYKKEALDSLYDYLDSHPGNPLIIESILGMSEGKVKKDIFDTFEPDDSEDFNFLLTMAKYFIDDFEYSTGLAILEYIDEKRDLKEVSAVLIELLYRESRYSDVVNKWLRVQEQYRTHITDLVFILSCIRVNRFDLVDGNIEDITQRWSSLDFLNSYKDILSRWGALFIFTLVSQRRAQGIPIDIDECDPFSVKDI